MELTYPINFVGLEVGAAFGDVLTRRGEHLGKWIFTEYEDQNTGGYHFFGDGQTEARFSEDKRSVCGQYAWFIDANRSRQIYWTSGPSRHL